jgi:hypothetical protein
LEASEVSRYDCLLTLRSANQWPATIVSGLVQCNRRSEMTSTCDHYSALVTKGSRNRASTRVDSQIVSRPLPAIYVADPVSFQIAFRTGTWSPPGTPNGQEPGTRGGVLQSN